MNQLPVGEQGFAFGLQIVEPVFLVAQLFAGVAQPFVHRAQFVVLAEIIEALDQAELLLNGTALLLQRRDRAFQLHDTAFGFADARFQLNDIAVQFIQLVLVGRTVGG